MKFETGNNASIITHHGVTPKIHPSAFLCEGVRIIGDVTIEENVSVWFNTVIRGDVNTISIGANTNIQDLSMLHVTNKKWALKIGRNVTVAHTVTLHGCTIEDYCLIGIGARILDGAVIGHNSIIAAGSLIREGFKVPPKTLAAGVPAKIIKELSDEEIIRYSSVSNHYITYVEEYRNEYKNFLKIN